MIFINIKKQFDRISKDYDKQRRQLIPCFDDLYELPLTVMNYNGEQPRILDIGGGTGLFTSYVMKTYPKAEYTLIDLSAKMLNVAEKRFANCGNVTYIIADYTSYQYDTTYDIAISSLSIHHLPSESKKSLYKRIYSILNNGGIFINADQMLSPYADMEEQYVSLWHTFIENSGLEKEEVKNAYERMKMDDPSTLNEQLEWLKEAGFSSVDCLYKYRNFCTIYAKKQQI